MLTGAEIVDVLTSHPGGMIDLISMLINLDIDVSSTSGVESKHINNTKVNDSTNDDSYPRVFGQTPVSDCTTPLPQMGKGETLFDTIRSPSATFSESLIDV